MTELVRHVTVTEASNTNHHWLVPAGIRRKHVVRSDAECRGPTQSERENQPHRRSDAINNVSCFDVLNHASPLMLLSTIMFYDDVHASIMQTQWATAVYSHVDSHSSQRWPDLDILNTFPLVTTAITNIYQTFHFNSSHENRTEI